MTSQAQFLERDTEREFLESLRARYEDQGFTFTVQPEKAQLPEFLGSYIPDALAQKPGNNVIIEVKSRQTVPTDRALNDIRQLFDGHSDWQFHVALMGSNPLRSVTVPLYDPSMIQTRANEVRALITEGQRRAAFIMAWSLLEAALRARKGETTGPARTPGTVVQTLAANGYIEPDVEQRMRALIDVRNRIVHGDLAAEPAEADIDLVLSTIEETLKADTSSA
jgi:uncharacterized protein YutE (UPF0331/DUF86 family)